MLDILLDKLKSIFQSRIIPIIMVFIILFGILIQRLFTMQILEGESSPDLTEVKESASRDIKSTRGLIYDRNGVLLAGNELRYSVVMCQNGVLTDNKDINTMIYKLVQLLEKNGNEIELDFGIAADAEHQDELYFTLEGDSLRRFKQASYLSYGKNFTEEKNNADVLSIYHYLKYDRFEISDSYSIRDALNIMKIRYTLDMQNPVYSQFILSSDVSTETVSAIKEYSAELPGVDIKQQTYRVYYDALYFAHIIGYTGQISQSELEDKNLEILPEEEKYVLGDYIGKHGIEESMEDILNGEKGWEELVLSDGKKLISSSIIKEPVKGDDIYLSIDRDLQKACYYILESSLAEILLQKIHNGTGYGTKGESASGILIPIYEVYNALIANSTIDIKHFKAEDATDLEKQVYNKFLSERTDVFDTLRSMTAFNSTVTNESAGSEMQVYLEYLYQLMQSAAAENLVVRSRVDNKSQMYQDYVNSKIGLSEYLKYAITERWVNLEVLGIEEEWLDIDEIYQMMMEYVFELLKEDKEFEKLIYKTLIFSNQLTGKEICLLLFDQEVIAYNENDYNRLSSGVVSAYTFIREKIENIEITPAQLALDPFSGSIVINDVKTGEVLAMATYPSYDNSKLANRITDVDFYNKLQNDLASPMLSRATQVYQATGSTFKPLAGLIGLGEDLITTTTLIQDKGIFDLVDPAPKCWIYPGSHGKINLSRAIEVSCNYFFYEIGHKLSNRTINEYGEQFGLKSVSGVEVEETAPKMAETESVVRAMIGYGHEIAPVQIARYISTVASKGSCLKFTLLHKLYDGMSGSMIQKEKVITNQVSQFDDTEWNAVHLGMYNMVNKGATASLFNDLGVSVAGKTGTAQVSTTRPNHALFTSFAPYEDPEISVTVVLPNAYTSANAVNVGSEVYALYYKGENKEALLSGNVKAGTATNVVIHD